MGGGGGQVVKSFQQIRGEGGFREVRDHDALALGSNHQHHGDVLSNRETPSHYPGPW